MKLIFIVHGLTASIILPGIASILFYRSLSPAVKFLAWLMIVGMACETVMISMAWMNVNNLFTVHIYSVVEIGLLSLYFHRMIKSWEIRKAILLIGAALAAFAIVYALSGNNISEFNSLPRALECFYFSVLSLWLFYEMANSTQPIDHAHYFINGSVMFYFTACFLVFGFSKAMMASEYIITMVLTHSGINAFCNITYAIGLWISTKRHYSHA